MKKLEDYIPKLRNREKIDDIDDNIINIELKIGKMGSKLIVIKSCIKEMENQMFKLREKFLNHPQSQKIRDEIEDMDNKLRDEIKTFNKLNDKICRKEIALIKLKQERKEQIRIGTIAYRDEIKLRHEKLQHEISKQNVPDKNNVNELKELEDELEYINQLVNREFAN